MHVMIARFNYDLAEAEFQGSVKELAPAFANIPGCFEKTWLHDAAAHSSGGIYKFRDERSVREYVASDLWAAVKSNPHFSNLEVTVIGTLEEATAVTHGMPREAAAV